MKKILVVDDERQIRRALGLNLTARDYDVIYAETGDAAVQVTASEHPDLVLLDLGLPGIGGIGVIEALRGWRWSGRWHFLGNNAATLHLNSYP